MTCTPYRLSNYNADGEAKVPSPGRRLTSDSTGMDVDGGSAPAVASSEEHSFYLENDAGSIQLSPGSGYAWEGEMIRESAVWLQRRVSNESDSSWSDTLESLGITSSTVDEDPFATSDNEDDALSRQPVGRPFPEQTWNQSGSVQVLGIPSDPYSSASSPYYLEPPIHTQAYSSGRRHSESHMPQRPLRPILHRHNPSDSFIIRDMKNLHVGEGFEAQSASPSLPSTSSSSYSHSGYPSPSNDDSSDRLSIPIVNRTVMRRNSDSAGQCSRQIPGILHHRHSASVLGLNTYDAVPANHSPTVQGTSSSLSNALGEHQYRTSIASAPHSTDWDTPSRVAPSTVDPSSIGMSPTHGIPSSPSLAWDTQMYPRAQADPTRSFAAEANNSQPSPTEHGGHVTEMQGPDTAYQSSGAPSTYAVQAHSFAPSGYDLVNRHDLYTVDTQNLAGYHTSTVLSSPQSYSGVFFPTSQDSTEYNAVNNALGDASLESPPILYVCGQRVPSDSESTSTAPTMPVPDVPSPDPETAVAGPSTTVFHVGCKQTRGARKPDPQAQQKMRKVNGQPRHFCTQCSPTCGFTIKSALARHTRDKHGGGPPPTCQVCGNVYRDQTSVQRHWRNQHGPNSKVGKPPGHKKLKQH